MVRCADRRVGQMALLILMVVLGPIPVLGQIYSRPASVSLIATLESLSVFASTPIAATKMDGTSQLTITSGWAIPANLTTVRLSVHIERTSRSASAPGSLLSAIRTITPNSKRRQSGSPCPPISTDACVAYGGNNTIKLFARPSGSSSRPITQSEHLMIISGMAAGTPSVPSYHSDIVYIVVQSL